MKGGRTAPRNCMAQARCKVCNPASMKGGRTAPRNLKSSSSSPSFCHCFNEGGADCPPKHHDELVAQHSQPQLQ